MSPETARRLDAALREQMPFELKNRVPEGYKLTRIDFRDDDTADLVYYSPDRVRVWTLREVRLGQLLSAWFDIV